MIQSTLVRDKWTGVAHWSIQETMIAIPTVTHLATTQETKTGTPRPHHCCCSNMKISLHTLEQIRARSDQNIRDMLLD